MCVLFSELTALAVGSAWMPGGKDSTGVCAEQATGHVLRGMPGRPYAPLWLSISHSTVHNVILWKFIWFHLHIYMYITIYMYCGGPWYLSMFSLFICLLTPYLLSILSMIVCLKFHLCRSYWQGHPAHPNHLGDTHVIRLSGFMLPGLYSPSYHHRVSWFPWWVLLHIGGEITLFLFLLVYCIWMYAHIWYLHIYIHIHIYINIRIYSILS